MDELRAAAERALTPCPFCGNENPTRTERPDNIDGTQFFAAIACYCGGYSACAHKMAVAPTQAEASAQAAAAWNRRAAGVATWREHDNTGMRFPESCDLAGGATDSVEAAPPQASSPSERQEARDGDWILAIGTALGLDSGFRVPIVPSVDEFRRLFAAVRQERQEAAAAGQGERAEWDVLNVVAQEALAGRITEMGVMVEACHAIRAAVRASLPASPSQGQRAAARDVLAERQRQISAEGWTPEHDNAHADGSLACAASCYACAAAGLSDAERDWPWNGGFKVASPRRMLVKAGALILAEIERLDRAAPSQPAQGDA